MKKSVKIVLLVSMTIIGSGCASIDFYEVNSVDGKAKEVGFLYYPPKPYLLIEKKDNSLVTKIISLPDTTRPHRVKQDNGWGSAELGFSIENGMIKSFNSKIDSKAPEALASIAGIATAKAALDTAKAAILQVKSTTGATTKEKSNGKVKNIEIPDSYNIKVFNDGYQSIKNNVISELSVMPNIFKNEIESLTKIEDELKKTETIKYNPMEPDLLLEAVEEKRKLASKFVIRLKNISTTLDLYANNEKKLESALPSKNANIPLKVIIEAMSKFSLRSSSIVGLYEISYIGNKLDLRKVVF